MGSVSCLAGSGRSESYRRVEIIDQVYPGFLCTFRSFLVISFSLQVLFGMVFPGIWGSELPLSLHCYCLLYDNDPIIHIATMWQQLHSILFITFH